MTSIWGRANPQLRDLAVYEPGKPIEETARELQVDPGAIIKLASNENPLGPSPKAIQAMSAALENGQLYPDGGGFYLRSALAARLGFARENIILGNGSNEVIEFLGNPPDTLQYIRDGRDIVVLRTFSKIHGLASLRVGYGIARRELIEVLQKTRQPFNVNQIAQVGALAALTDEAHQRETQEIVDAGRNYLQEQFREMKLKFVPGAANFVMVNVGDGAVVFKKLLAQKIIVRPLKGYNLPEWVRITVGTMEQNKKCIAALKKVLL